jgi:hypothetical protein
MKSQCKTEKIKENNNNKNTDNDLPQKRLGKRTYITLLEQRSNYL